MSASFYREKTHQARKKHLCAACEKAIEPGEIYLRVSGIWEDGFDSFSYHPDCREWETHLNCSNYPEEWTPLHEVVSDSFGEALEGAPDRVRKRFERLIGEQEVLTTREGGEHG